MGNWFLDEGYFLDEEHDAILAGEGTLSSSKEQMIMYPAAGRILEMYGTLEGTVRHTVPVDLLPLLPRKFHSSDIAQEFVKETGLMFGEFLTKIRDIPNLLNPNVITDPAYFRYLGALIGVVFPPEDETSVGEMRKILSQAVDWYKVKGTYQAMLRIALVSGLTVNLYDLYTKDYETFIEEDWFVGDEGENPPGLTPDYYKSPHFGFEVLLDHVYTASTGESGASGEVVYDYLWKSSYLDNVIIQIEEVRPVHTVPHFSILLNPRTDEFGHIIEVEGEIRAKVTGDWQYGTKYFDLEGSGNAWNFDDGTIFDQSADLFVKSIIRFKLGDGDCQLGDSFVSLKHPVYTGSINPDDITILGDRYQFKFVVPKTVPLSNISELGLYIPGSPDVLVLASSFPKITKGTRESLKVIVEVFKSDLSI